MPNAALIALTSPLLLGEVPESALSAQDPPHIAVAPVIGFGPDYVTATEHSGLLSLNWSLVASQSQPGPEDLPEGEEGDDQDEGNRIIVTGEYGPPENDPMERVNEESYRITQQLDEVFVEPVAYAYRDGLPGPLRDGLGNVVRNLGEPNNALNFLLQGKFGKAFETLGRLLINSTLGLGGLIDLAEKPGIGLPYRRNGFGNTLGFYGVGSGPYLYLPVTGATTARDLVGSGLDQLLLPVAVGKPFNQLEFTAPYFVINSLDSRLEVDEELERIGETLNPYAARRDTYLYRREKAIAELKGEQPPEPPLILEEVEGTGDFADPPEDAGPDGETGSTNEPAPEPLSAVIITQPVTSKR
ncbi:MAG: VacJ family lipoprotein [Pseudomonadota bacterium]